MLPIFLVLSCWLTAVVSQVITAVAPDSVVVDHAQKVIQDKSSMACERACASIAASFPSLFFLKDEGNFVMWDGKQEEQIPACRVEPSTAEEVSHLLKIVIEHQCHFAVRGGGHSRIPGSSNAHGGVTFDLAKLNTVTIAGDKKTVKVGGGSVWGDVYRTLEKDDFTVVGGRVADVGVGGLTLGGGLSFLSNRHGFACDSVTAFEIVLPDTSVQTVSQETHPDLYWALRGGGNNFGIVTAFHMELIPRKAQTWRGTLTYSVDKNAALMAAMHEFVTVKQEQDVDAVGWLAHGWIQQYNMSLSVIALFHLTHDDPTTWPPAFDAFFAIERLPNATEIVVKPQSDITEDIKLQNPYHQRTIYKTITYRSSAEMDVKIMNLANDEFGAVGQLEGIMPFVVFHPTPAGMTAPMGRNGGNPLGIEGSGPLTIVMTSWMWRSPADDTINEKAVNNLFDRATKAAKDADVLVPYIYQNYAWKDQDVYASYGEQNHARLKSIQKKVDPDGVFSGGDGLCRGYFKINTKLSSGGASKQQGRDEL